MPSAGDMRQSVRFERRASASDGYGNAEGDWLEFIAKRSVSLLPVKGGAEVVAQRLQGVEAYTLLVYSDSQTRQLTDADRVVDRRDQNRVFKIIGQPKDPDGKRRWLLIQLELGKADG
jgi:hypothetical protein